MIMGRVAGRRLEVNMLIANRIPFVIFVVLLLLCAGCDAGLKVTKYKSMHFYGSGSSNSMSIQGDPPLEDIDVVLPDGNRIHVASITRESVHELFGPPFQQVKDGPRGDFEKFGDVICSVSFE